MRFRIFISSVQAEFAQERRELKSYLLHDPLLRDYISDVFLFEDVPATHRDPIRIYLPEIADTDIYIGIFGSLYGSSVTADGRSPTECEYDEARRAGAVQWIYFHDSDMAIDFRMKALRQKASVLHTYKKVSSIEELKREVYASFIDYLRERRLLTHEPFDASFAYDASMDDIDEKRLGWFVDKAVKERGFAVVPGEDSLGFLTRLGLAKRGKIRNAALLLFGKNPRSVCMSAMVKCTFCAGTEYARPFVQQVYEGTLFDQIDQALMFVMSRIDRKVGIARESAVSPESFEIPREAVRELLVNAVAHRNYFSHASVEVRLFHDRLEVWNPGEMPEGLPIDWLFEEHESIPFNELLAEPLYQTRYIERAGTGISVIVNACREVGLPAPSFEIRHRFFVATVFRPQKATGNISAGQRTVDVENRAVDVETVSSGNRTVSEGNRTVSEGNRTARPKNRTVKAGHGIVMGGGLSKAMRRLLLAMSTDTVSSAILLKRLGIKSRGALSMTYTQPGLRDGLLEMLYPDSRRAANQAYRLTKKGLALLTRESRTE